ncbi:unnamed protein product [Cuscuta europaea]|uniref:Glycosyltransferase n=1 Tax=Cuscuta europaea TaxID=41803 RepID=A0A9P1EGN4_CUSEU|nr:unnamed protein product [Cuscuta europaea]
MEREKLINVLLFPWIAKGHVTPYLELAKKLSKRNFQVHFCSSPIILESIREILAKQHPDLSSSVHLIELHLPSSPELPPNHHITSVLPPHLAKTLQMAFQKTERAFCEIISTLNPDLLIYDGFQPWAASQASSLNIPSIHLLTTGAVTMTHFLYYHVNESRSELPFPANHYLDHEIHKYIEQYKNIATEETVDIAGLCFKALQQSHSIILINTCSEIEAKYIDYLSLLTKKEVLPIGPLIREEMDEDEHEEITKWLQEKKESSCVLASFGSEYCMTKGEVEEIAHGLEQSKVNFIWSLRFPVGVNMTVEDAVPQGYLERVRDKGLVVGGWIPQGRILRDKRICAFLSHCGWNSVLESLACGVPIIALPLHLDQPLNARLVEEIGVGVEVMKGENGEINREEVAKALTKFVMEEDRKALATSMECKAKELSKMMRLRGDIVIDDAINKLLRICKKMM